ncbi:MAG: OmpA family protein [Proteobacteria bacterium]|nr:OmpA family protein [Pseudomonadota bacterium]MBU1738102.1 OmpA family protein [Pseudomonadota bacterium]
MTRKFQVISGLVLVTHFVGLVAVSNVFSADCKVLYDNIRKERTLMKKKDMAGEGVKACPNDVAIVYEYGYTMERLRKYEDALDQYKKAVELDSSYAKAYFSVGDIQMLLKNYREAVVAYQLGLQHDSADERAKASLKDARAKYKQATGNEPPAPPPPLKKAVAAKVTPVEVAPAETKKEVKPTPAPMVHAEAPIIRLDVPFSKKSATLSQDALDVLSVVVGQAMNRPDMKNVRFEIGGHADDVGDAPQNEEVSKKRAEAVRDYLLENFGVSGDRLSVAAYGHKRPKVPNTSPENQELNRRVGFSRTD